MNVRQAYNLWANQYDTNDNKTRDLEARALRETLEGLTISHCLEIGCGTGKNTVWLSEVASNVTAADLSEEMLAIARGKVTAANTNFQQADILQPWTFGAERFDLITFSLVLEHIPDLGQLFTSAAQALKEGGRVYVGELHPFKQYTGTKARFDLENQRHIVDCYEHHVSDFTNAAKQAGLQIELIEEYFDENDRTEIPRILVLMFRK